MNMFMYYSRIILFVLIETIININNTKGGAVISNVRLDPSYASTSSHKGGVLQVEYNNTWRYVCIKGADEGDSKWGKQEAMVACRHLGYKGGWTMVVNEDSNPISDVTPLDDFVCRGDESTLENCSYDPPNVGCLESGRDLVGIRLCYGTYEERLVGGPAPNAGRLEIKFDNTWANVCYDPIITSNSVIWKFNNAQVLCKSLGYPTALFTRPGGFGKGERRAFVRDYNCQRGDEQSLQYCLPDFVMNITSSSTNQPCGWMTEGGNEVAVVCAVPGYLGCLADAGDVEDKIFEFMMGDSESMTTSMCRTRCLRNEFRYAGLTDTSVCTCGDEAVTTFQDDENCNYTCSGADHEFCGGPSGMISVYDVTVGQCDNPNNKTDVYYFGDIFTGINCETGYVIQCILGNAVNKLMWNDTLPGCEETSRSDTSDTIADDIYSDLGGEDNNRVGVWVGVSIGLILLIIIVTIVIVLMFRRRGDRNKQSAAGRITDVPPGSPSASTEQANTTGPHGKHASEFELSKRSSTSGKVPVHNDQNTYDTSYEDIEGGTAVTSPQVTAGLTDNRTNISYGKGAKYDQAEEEGWTENSVYETSTEESGMRVHPPLYAAVNKGSKDSVDEGWEDNRLYESSTTEVTVSKDVAASYETVDIPNQ